MNFVRVATCLPTEPQALYTRGTAIFAAILADPVHFPQPYPPPGKIEADLTELGGALQAVESGSLKSTVALRVADAKVRQTFCMLGMYVQSVVRAGPIEDAPALISSVLMYENQAGKRAPKPELAVRPGAVPGSVRMIALAVATALVYHWEYSADGQTWIPLPPTGRADSSLGGLTPGQVYAFRFRIFRRDGVMTEPCNAISVRVQ